MRPLTTNNERIAAHALRVAGVCEVNGPDCGPDCNHTKVGKIVPNKRACISCQIKPARKNRTRCAACAQRHTENGSCVACGLAIYRRAPLCICHGRKIKKSNRA